MTIHTEKTAPTAPTVDTESKSIAERSITTAYISYQPDDTRDTFATFSRADLPRKQFAKIVVPMRSVLRMLDGEVLQLRMDPEEIESHNIERQRARRERDERRREALERKVSKEVYEKYDEEYKQLDAEADKLYGELNAIVLAEIKAEIQRQERKQ